MRKELSPGAALGLLISALLILIGGLFLYSQNQRRQQAEDIEKVIQRGVGLPPAPRAR